MADPTKLMKLLEIAEKFGIKRSKIIGTQGNIVPLKKPSLTSVDVDEFKLRNSIEDGTMTKEKFTKELEETLKLALSNNLNSTELSKAVNNVVKVDREFFPPSADVIAAGSGEQVTGKGLEELIQKGGLMAPPNTPLGKADFQIKRAKQGVEDIKKELDIGNLIKGAGKDQLSEIRLHNEGLVRAVTRQILSEDIRAGKIKSLDLEKLGTSREPIDYFRKIYGEDALERLDSIAPEFNRFYTEKEATDFARSKFKFEPNEARAAGSASYEDVEKAKETKDERSFLERLFGINKDKGKKEAEVLNITAEGDKRKSIDQLIDEYNANYDRTLLTDEEGGSAISYQEFQDLHKRNKEIAKALEEKGIKSTPDVEEVKPTTGEVIPFRKKFTEPEEKSMGGRIGYAKGKRVKSSIDKLLENLNTKLSKKESMETVNPKTGEVTVPKKPIKRAEEPTGVTVMDQEPVSIVDDVAKQTKEFTDDEMISYIKKYKEEGPTLEEFTKRINEQTGSNFTPEQLAHAYRVKVAYPHSTPIVDSEGKFIGGGLYNPPLDVSISDRDTLTKSIVQTRKAKGLSVPKKYQEEIKAAEVVETPETPPKAGEGRFTKQQVLEKIIQSTIEANPTDEYVQKTFPNFIKEIREKPELANNENVWRTFTQDFPENKRLVVYGDDTVDFFTKGEDLPRGMQQTQELADTYGLSMEEATRIKQMEPEDQVMEIKKLQVLKNRTQNANGGIAGLL